MALVYIYNVVPVSRMESSAIEQWNHEYPPEGSPEFFPEKFSREQKTHGVEMSMSFLQKKDRKNV